MVDHHHRLSKSPGLGERLDARGAAIDRDQERRSLRGQCSHRFGVGAITLEQPVRNVDQGIEPAMAQMPREQGGRRCAVDVIVTEDRDFLAAHGGIRDALCSDLHLRNRERIRHHLADGRIEKIRHGVELDVAPGEHARQHFRQLVALRDRKRARRPAHIEPVAPQLSRKRLLHAEKGLRQFRGQRGRGLGHEGPSIGNRGQIRDRFIPSPSGSVQWPTSRT